MNYPQYILAWMLDVIYPIKCINCGKFPGHLKKEYLCDSCTRKLPIRKTLECIGCKSGNTAGKTCINCRTSNYIDQLLIVSDYNNPVVVNLIKCLKYKFVKEMTGPISFLIKKYVYMLSKDKKLNLLEEKPVITSVPLESRRLNWRGFNQAELIAESLGDTLQINPHNGLLSKIKSTKPQAEINERQKRLEIPVDTFKVKDNTAIHGQTIIIVDDVCTTGATLNACARVLKESGAKKIIGFVVARG